MNRFPYLVGEVAANQPTDAQAYELSGTALQGLRSFASALSAGDIADGDSLLGPARTP